MAAASSSLEGRRRVDPDEHRLAVVAVAPGVAAAALEIEAVAGAEVVEFMAVQHDLDAAGAHMDEFLAIVLVSAVAR